MGEGGCNSGSYRPLGEGGIEGGSVIVGEWRGVV